MSRYKLKCFNCGHPITRKRDVWRDMEGKPTCRDCIEEYSNECEDQEAFFSDIEDHGRDARKVPLRPCVNYKVCGEEVFTGIETPENEVMCNECTNADDGVCISCWHEHPSVTLQNRECPACVARHKEGND